MSNEPLKFVGSGRFAMPERYYALPIEERFSWYGTTGEQAYARRSRALRPFSSKEERFPEVKRLTPEQLQEELVEIIPSFKGKVVGRFFYPQVVLHYIVDQEGMDVFGETTFGPFVALTGKVVGTCDGLLSPDYETLSGLVILQPEQDSEQKKRFVAFHELYHSQHYDYPNASRIGQYMARSDSDTQSPEELAEVLIGLDQAIILDEAGACVNAYNVLKDGERLRLWSGFAQEVANSSRNMIGMRLDALRRNGSLEGSMVDRINAYEISSRTFPATLKRSIDQLSQRMSNPEHLEPIGYASMRIL